MVGVVGWRWGGGGRLGWGGVAGCLARGCKGDLVAISKYSPSPATFFCEAPLH